MARCLTLSLLLIVGCTSSSDSSTDKRSSAANNEKPRVALIMKSLANPFFATMEAGATSHQREHANEYDLISNGIKDESDLGRQVALVDEMVASGVDAIVIAPADSKALVPALRKAVKAGVVVVNIDNRLDAEVLEQEGVTIPFVGPDNQVGARKVAEYLATKLEPDDHVAVLEGMTTAFNAIERRRGFNAAMEQAGIEIVTSQSANWETNQANTIAASMLSEHPEIKAILAANDSMAVGAVAAVKAAGRTGEVLIIGFDNIEAVQELLRENKILATVDQHSDDLAAFGIETALTILKDPATIPADVETPVDLVTNEDLVD